MQNEINSVRAFHIAFNCPQRPVGHTDVIEEQEYNMRKVLMEEEVQETIEELIADNNCELTAELADIMYIAGGTAAQFGLDTDSNFNTTAISMLQNTLTEYQEAIAQKDLEKVNQTLIQFEIITKGIAHSKGLPIREMFDEINNANMRKLGPDGKAILREDGKILKPEGWYPADKKGVYNTYKKEV